MKNNRKKFFPVILSAIMILSCFAACSKTPDKEPTGESGTSTVETVSSDETTAEVTEEDTTAEETTEEITEEVQVLPETKTPSVNNPAD